MPHILLLRFLADLLEMGCSDNDKNLNVTIPVLMISKSGGEVIKNSMSDGHSGELLAFFYYGHYYIECTPCTLLKSGKKWWIIHHIRTLNTKGKEREDGSHKVIVLGILNVLYIFFISCCAFWQFDYNFSNLDRVCKYLSHLLVHKKVSWYIVVIMSVC